MYSVYIVYLKKIMQCQSNVYSITIYFYIYILYTEYSTNNFFLNNNRNRIELNLGIVVGKVWKYKGKKIEIPIQSE